ncbi:guanine deaminase [Pararobbsia silviterrae]|uniref:Guanine deaminase n=2 Tax=Pararobbsia silviterrae TaxID=1792498 RepID=A0A494Y969_9BURK|nr:guanine deaminase [Pararobbsia silviterrae]RKP59229.1 guanine deaminase [Pararobbsia silviterrae]
MADPILNHAARTPGDAHAPSRAPSRRAAYRARLLTFRVDPALDEHAAVYHEDGLLIVGDDGKVVAFGDYASLHVTLDANTPVHAMRDKLITPGFIDTHLHFPQTEMIASPASGLLPWLENWTFPAERTFEDAAHAADVAAFFIDELLACGTTTALVYCSVHRQSAEALFAEAHARDLRMIAGKVLMDRHCPEYLRDTAQSGYDDSRALIERWHGTGRQLYALTPRFAPTSTEAQLEACRTLARAYPDIFIQSHVAENHDEIRWVAELFPERRSYLDVYDHYELLRARAVYGHCIHLDDADRIRMAETQAIAAHCPTSNLFLGSGLFDFDAAARTGMPVTLATDVGGGTSFSMLQTMNEAHKVARMGGHHLSALRMFYLATAGAARALDLDDRIGTLAVGTEADFIVLDPAATPLMARRTARVESLEELLFAFALLGDDRAILATYANGRRVHARGMRQSALAHA